MKVQRSPVSGLRWAVCVVVFAAAALFGPATAGAQITLTGFEAPAQTAGGSEITQAGAHPHEVLNRFTFEVDFLGLPTASLRDTIVDLPVGFVGDPSRLPRCVIADLSAGTCPASSQIGTFSVIQAAIFGGGVLTSGLYNMDVPQGQPARFGTSVVDQTLVFLHAEVRPEDDGITIRSTEAPLNPIVPIVGVEVRMWGVPADPAHDAERGGPAGYDPIPFITTQTNCDTTPVTRLRVNSWQDPDVWDSAEYVAPAMEGCEVLDFDPAVKVQPQSTVADSPSAYTVELTQKVPDSAESLASAHLKDAVVSLPEGVAINPAAADGIDRGCSEAEMGLGKAGAPSCPAASTVGQVRIETPTLDEPLVGPVFQAAQGANPFGSTLAIYMAPESERYGVRIKLAGEIAADPVTGRLTATFRDNPQLPFTKLTMTLKGGNRAVLVNPATCGPKTTDWSMSSWARPGEEVSGTDTFTIDSGPNGMPCAQTPAALPFGVGMDAGSVNPVGGAFSPFVLRLTRPDGHRQITGLSAELPEGVLAKLAGVPYCPESALAPFAGKVNTALGSAAGEIASPACAGSEIGRVTVGAGAGPSPYYLQTGRAYLAGPYKGAPLSLAAIVPVKAGPFDLGSVMVRNAMHVDRTTAQVTVVSDPLPTIVEGIPLRIRDLRVEIDRPEFTVNPTDCTAKQVTAAVGGEGGASADLASRYQVAGCAGLSFKPRLGLRLVGGKQRRTGGHPALRARLTHGGVGSAGIGRARVKLPRWLALDPDNAQALCEFVDGTKPDLEAHCPAGSKVGRARASSPLLERDLVGDVYFVKNVRVDPETGNEIRTLPMIVVALRGQIALNLRGVATTTRNGQLVSTFKQVPDAPLDRFNLNIKGGANGILVVTGDRSGDIDLCRSPQRTRTIMAGHNGARVNALSKVRTPCPKGRNAAKGKRNRR